MPFRLPRPPPTSGRMEEENRIRVFFPSVEINDFQRQKVQNPVLKKSCKRGCPLSLSAACDTVEHIEITSWKARAYGIFTRVGEVSEIERVSAANE